MEEREIGRPASQHTRFRKWSDDTGREILERLGVGVLRASLMPRAPRSPGRFRLAADRRAIALLLGGYAAGAIAFPRLPGPSQHVSMFVRLLVAFTLPTAAVAVHVLFRSLLVRDRAESQNAAAEETYDALIFRILLFLVALHALVLANLLGTDAIHLWAQRGVIVLVGVAIAGIGQLLLRLLYRRRQGHRSNEDPRPHRLKIVR